MSLLHYIKLHFKMLHYLVLNFVKNSVVLPINSNLQNLQQLIGKAVDTTKDYLYTEEPIEEVIAFHSLHDKELQIEVITIEEDTSAS